MIWWASPNIRQLQLLHYLYWLGVRVWGSFGSIWGFFFFPSLKALNFCSLSCVLLLKCRTVFGNGIKKKCMIRKKKLMIWWNKGKYSEKGRWHGQSSKEMLSILGNAYCSASQSYVPGEWETLERVVLKDNQVSGKAFSNSLKIFGLIL
jgi:hypothetical protein